MSATWRINIDPQEVRCLPQSYFLVRQKAPDVIERGKAAPGHVVNLGHGVPPETDPTILTRLVELIHAS